MIELLEALGPYVPYLIYASPGLMLLGYVLYIRQTLKREIEPNPFTWVMFAYGTGLLAILEFDRLEWSQNFDWSFEAIFAALTLLGTPIVCALCSLWVAAICFRRGKIRWPEKWGDRISFSTDILLTICYGTAWALLAFGQIAPEDRALASLVFLACSNLSTITAFTPLLGETRQDPRGERSLPWVVWTFSYATLFVVTYHETGLWHELMIYPVMNTILHFMVAVLAFPYRRRQKRLEELEKAYQTF